MMQAQRMAVAGSTWAQVYAPAIVTGRRFSGCKAYGSHSGTHTSYVLLFHISNGNDMHSTCHADTRITLVDYCNLGPTVGTHKPPSMKMPDSANFCLFGTCRPHTMCRGRYSRTTSRVRFAADIPQ